MARVEPSGPDRVGRAHVPGLDGLRALAALAVVGFHLRLAGFHSGWLGVDVFFVLSGFLITGILLRELTDRGTVSFRRFYTGRALRLLPAYVTVVLVCLVADRVIHAGATLKGAVFSFFYVANWALATGGALGSLDHTWSLSIEEQFYVVWPLVLLGLWRLARRHHLDLRVVVGVLLGLLVVGCVAAVQSRISMPALVDGSHFRAAELVAGCLLACLLVPGRPGRTLTAASRWTGPLGLAGLVGLTSMVVLVRVVTPADELWAWLGIAACTALVIVASLRISLVGCLLSIRPLVVLGRMSYGLYLWHFPVLVTIDARWGLEGAWPKVAAAAVTGALVVVSYHLVEQPFLRWKRRREQPTPVERMEPDVGPTAPAVAD